MAGNDGCLPGNTGPGKRGPGVRPGGTCRKGQANRDCCHILFSSAPGQEKTPPARICPGNAPGLQEFGRHGSECLTAEVTAEAGKQPDIYDHFGIG